MHKYGESKTTRIMMATVRHVTAYAGHPKYRTDGFLFDGMHNLGDVVCKYVYCHESTCIQSRHAETLHIAVSDGIP